MPRPPRLSRAALGVSLLLEIGLLVACGQASRETRPPSIELQPSTPGPKLTPAPAGVWQSYEQSDGIPYPSVTSVAFGPDGDIWLGTARGLARFDGGAWTSYGVENGMLSELVLDVAVDPAGVVWLGTNVGVTRFDGELWTHFGEDDGLPAGFVQVVEPNASGRVWFGFAGAGDDWAFGNGAARVDDGGTAGKGDDRWDIFLPTRDRMAGDIVSSVVDLGMAGVWFGVTPEGTVRGSGQGGLWRLLGSETVSDQDDVWTAMRAADGLTGSVVTALAASPEGGLWIGTTAGLMHAPFDASGSLLPDEARLYSADDGLPSDRILSIAVDAADGVWVGSDAGIAHIVGDVIRSITKSDGLADNAVRSVIVTGDGAVWAATPSGVSVKR